MMLNTKTHQVYNSNFILNVLYLHRTEFAGDDDRKWGIDKWAKLFKAGTWEELRMVALDNEALREAAERVFVHNSDENFRDYCRARQDAINHEKWVNERMESLESQIAEKNHQLTEKDQQLSAKDAEIAELKRRLKR